MIKAVRVLGLVSVMLAAGWTAPTRAQSEPAGYWEGWEDLAGCVDASGDPNDGAHVGLCGSVEQACLSFNEMMGNPGLVRIEMLSQKRVKCFYNHLFSQTPVLLCPSARSQEDPGISGGCRAPDTCRNCMGDGSNPGSNDGIQLSGGNNQQSVVDFTTAGPNALSFVRAYNSHGRTGFGVPAHMPLGGKWLSNYDRYLVDTSSTVKTAYRPDGTVLAFTLASGVWKAPADVPLKLAQSGSDWVLTDLADTVETYDSSYRLTTIRKRNGYEHALAYDTNGKFSTVTDSYGRVLSFSFTGNRLTRMVAADGGVYEYAYDTSLSSYIEETDRLISVTYPRRDSTQSGPAPHATYHYEDSRYPLYLTGITDENGVRYSTFAYDGDAQGVSSERAGGVGQATISYDAADTRTETNELGLQTVYDFTTIQGVRKLASAARQATAGLPSATMTQTYDANGFLASRTDYEGNIATFVHDARGLETSRIEADGTAQERTTTTTWHGTLRVPTQIVAPGKTTDFTYDASGRVLTKTETDTRTQSVPYGTNGQTRTWTYTWDSTGLLQTVNGPRTDVTDVTTYDWSDGVLASPTRCRR